MNATIRYRISPAALAADTGALIDAAIAAPAGPAPGRPPSPAMMRRRVAPASLPVTADVRARRAAEGAAGHCAIAVVGTATRWAPHGVCLAGVLEVDVPGLPGWSFELSAKFTRPVDPTQERAAAFRDEIQAARVGMLAELMGKVPAIQAVHGRTLMTVTQEGGGDELGRRPFGLDSAAFAPRGKAASKRAMDRANAMVADALTRQAERVAEREAALPPLRMATDASHNRGRCGMAWVDEAGGFGVTYGTKMRIAEAETRALHAALKRARHMGGARPVLIESDSRRAVDAITADVDVERIQWAHGEAALMVAEARELATDPRITVRWVRGHNGHPLNELADRLAMHERRSRQWNLDREIVAGQQERIAADALPAIRDWVATAAGLEPVRVYDSGVAVIRRRLASGLRDLDRELASMDAMFTRALGSREDWGLAV